MEVLEDDRLASLFEVDATARGATRMEISGELLHTHAEL